MTKVEEFCERYGADRMGTNSTKWDALEKEFGDPDLISMWVADMDFRVPECVTEALNRRVGHEVYGYSYAPDSYFEAVIDWEKRHHGYEVKKEWIRISPGVVAALYWMMHIYTQPDDAVIILTPVYYPFHNCVKDTGRKLVTCDMKYDKGVFTVDYEAFEQKIVENQVKVYIQSSPHNPAGRVWTEEEQDRILSICAKHDVLVISDEIHQDLVFGGHRHIPAAMVSGGKYADNVITAFASSKTFNLAACQTSTIVIADEKRRQQWDHFTNVYHMASANVFGVTAVEAALRGGEAWYEGLKEVIASNYRMLAEEMKEFPEAYVAPLEGTYLAFLDLRSYVPLDQIKEFTQDKCRLAVDYGEWFGENWKGFIRLNLGTKPELVKQAVTNIKENLRKLN